MPVVLLLAALVILAGVVVVASGRGGEMAYEHPDYPPLDLGPVTAADVALLRPPSAAWGYNMRVTDEALTLIARAMSERDVRISSLQQQVDDLRAELARTSAPWPGARHAARAALSPGNRAADEARSDEARSDEARSDEERPDDVAPGGTADDRGTPGEERPDGAADTGPGRGAPDDEEPGGGPAQGTTPEGTGSGRAGPGRAGPGGAGPGRAGPEGAGPGRAGSEDAGSEGAGPEPAGPDDTVVDGSIPVVTATDLPRQAAPAGRRLEAEPPGPPPAQRDLADFREVRPAERGDT